MSLKSFFKEAATQPENIRAVISDRFKDDNGVPEQWELRALSEEENSQLKESCFKKVSGKGGKTTTFFNSAQYIKLVISSSIVYPDLTNADLQKSYAVVGEIALLNKMLLPGEMSTLEELAQRINGFDPEKLEQDIETVKNS